MLDINLFRTEKGGDPEIVRESQRRRFADVSLVDKVIALDAQWRDGQYAHSKASSIGSVLAARARTWEIHLYATKSVLAPVPAARYQLDGLNREFNALNKEIANIRKVG